jgi:hypothetical protein
VTLGRVNGSQEPRGPKATRRDGDELVASVRARVRRRQLRKTSVASGSAEAPPRTSHPVHDVRGPGGVTRGDAGGPRVGRCHSVSSLPSLQN